MTLDDILLLADRMPSGRNDQRAMAKFMVEVSEFWSAVDRGDLVGALTEIADLVYYYAKMSPFHRQQAEHDLFSALQKLGCDLDQGVKLAYAKYSLRARPGNPKNDSEERKACLCAI